METQKTKQGREYNSKYNKALSDIKFLNKQRDSFLTQDFVQIPKFAPKLKNEKIFKFRNH